MSSRLSPPIPRSVNDMSLAQEFIDALNTDNSADADHAALIGSDGDALLVRYRGQDLHGRFLYESKSPGGANYSTI